MKTAPARGSAEAAKPDRGGHGGVPKLRRAKWAYSNFEAARHPIRAGGPQVWEWKRPRYHRRGLRHVSRFNALDELLVHFASGATHRAGSSGYRLSSVHRSSLDRVRAMVVAAIDE